LSATAVASWNREFAYLLGENIYDWFERAWFNSASIFSAISGFTEKVVIHDAMRERGSLNMANI
jgi:hypothetical protein